MNGKELNTDEVGVTGCIGTAAALITLGYQIESIDDFGGNGPLFIFKQHRGTDEAIGKYEAGNLTVPAKAYCKVLTRFLSEYVESSQIV